jgi:hypothetical protein
MDGAGMSDADFIEGRTGVSLIPLPSSTFFMGWIPHALAMPWIPADHRSAVNDVRGAYATELLDNDLGDDTELCP